MVRVHVSLGIRPAAVALTRNVAADRRFIDLESAAELFPSAEIFEHRRQALASQFRLERAEKNVTNQRGLARAAPLL
jgi:hypothetical protein